MLCLPTGRVSPCGGLACQQRPWTAGGRVTNAVGTIFRKIFVGTRAHPI